MIRGVAAVVAGFAVTVVFVVLVNYVSTALLGFDWTEPTAALLGGYAASVVIAAALAGWTAARVARDAAVAAVLVLAGVILAQGVWSAASGPVAGQPSWYPWLLVVIGPGGVVFGGFLARPREGPVD